MICPCTGQRQPDADTTPGTEPGRGVGAVLTGALPSGGGLEGAVPEAVGVTDTGAVPTGGWGGGGGIGCDDEGVGIPVMLGRVVAAGEVVAGDRGVLPGGRDALVVLPGVEDEPRTRRRCPG